jgi:O-Antigen ligase
MLTFVLPLILYLLSFPIMIITMFKVEVGLLFFISLVPIIAVMKKIAALPQGNNVPDYLLIAMVIGWFVGASREGRKIFVSSPVNTAVILLIIGSVINLIRGYTFMSFSPEINLVRLMTWKNYMILPIFYFISANNVKTEKIVKIAIISISFTLLATDFNFYSTFRLLKTYHYSHDIRISGSFSFLGPNEMGIFYCMYTFLLLGISYYITNKWLRYFVIFVCAVNFYPILYSFSRGAYLCFLVGLLTLGVLKDRRMLIGLIALIFLYRLILPNSVVERIDMTFLEKTEVSEEMLNTSGVDIGDTVVNVTGRKHLWNMAMEYFKEHPFLGTGFDSFRHNTGWITHSLLYNILAEQGLLGLLVNLIFYWTIMGQSYKLFKNSKIKLGRGIGLGFFLCVIVFLVGVAGGDLSLYYNLMVIFWFFLGIVASFNSRFINNNNPASSSAG